MKRLLGDRLAGAVWGHLVGDAVGVPYEFGPPMDPAQVAMLGYGSHNQPAGTWSDDGALMLALLDSLLEKGFDTTDQAERALAWYRDGAYTPDGNRFDVGDATEAAIRRFANGTPAEECGSEDAGGNGSLMRILPLALVERNGPVESLIDHAQRASRVTHGDGRADVCCALYSLIARRLLAGDAPPEALQAATTTLRDHYASTVFAAYLGDHLDFVLAYEERAGRGRVWDSFWSAWDAFAGSDSYEQTIRRAVAYGDDTDTTAAIAGGLAGIYWGIGGIPTEWMTAMRGKEVVAPFLAKLLATAA